MKRLFAVLTALSLCTVVFAGCENKAAKVEKKETVTTPEGSTTTTESTKVETTGDNPPPAK